MKKMTLRDFYKNYTGFKGIRRGNYKFYRQEVHFTPAHRLLEIKLSHNLLCIHSYSKKTDSTILFIADRGIIALNFGELGTEGEVFHMHGKLDPENWFKDEKWDSVFTRMYNEQEREIRKAGEESAA